MEYCEMLSKKIWLSRNRDSYLPNSRRPSEFILVDLNGPEFRRFPARNGEKLQMEEKAYLRSGRARNGNNVTNIPALVANQSAVTAILSGNEFYTIYNIILYF